MKRRKFIASMAMTTLSAPVAAACGKMMLPLMDDMEVLSGTVYPYPDAPIPAATEFTVTANGEHMYVYNAASFRACSFAFEGPISVQVTYAETINTYAINPTSKGITATQTGNTLTFTLDAPAKLEVQINGGFEQAFDADKLLYIFADKPESGTPSPTDTRIYYFGPGLHTVPGNILSIGSGDPKTAIYLAPGAVLNAVVTVSRKTTFKIYGRGFMTNPFTDKSKSLLVVNNSSNVWIEDIHLFDSPQHVITFGTGLAADGHDITLKNIKSLHAAVNSDGISLFGPINGVDVNDCFIIGNDNLIVIGGGGYSEPAGPFNNTIKNTTFIKCGHAGNWCFLQGNSAANTGGNIGPGNLIKNCDVIRTVREKGLITAWWGDPSAIENVVFEGIRVQSYDDPSGVSTSRLIQLEETGTVYLKEITLRNINLPYAQTSWIAAGNWKITFDHVKVNGVLVTNDADLNLTKGTGVTTQYIY